MTEAEWMNWPTPVGMTWHVRDTITPRQLRSFANACCLRVQSLLPADRFARYFDLIERIANDNASRAERATATDELEHIEVGSIQEELAATALMHAAAPGDGHGLWMVWEAAAMALEVACGVGDAEWVRTQHDWRDRGGAVETLQDHVFADLLREVVGNPFCPVVADAAWLTWADGSVAKLARVIDDDRAFHQLPILADALLDAGCTDDALLSHLRSPGPHVRGCWALNAILGKA
jgi:hypothetical protein